MSYVLAVITLLIGVFIFFLIKFILKKFKIIPPNRFKVISFLIALCLSPIVYSLIVAIYLFSYSGHPQIKFNNNLWYSKIHERYKMSEDIIDSKMLIGKNKEGVIKLLGDDFYEYNSNHIAYYLGFVPRAFTIDPDVLDIYFEAGKVKKVNQHES